MKKIKSLSLFAILGVVALSSCGKANFDNKTDNTKTTDVTTVVPTTVTTQTTPAVKDTFELIFEDGALTGIELTNPKRVTFDEIVVPDSVNGKPITSITTSFFYKFYCMENPSIKKLVIGKNVSSMDLRYYGMPGVESVEIDPLNETFKITNNNYITSLDGKQLYRAFNVTSISIPEGVETLNEGCIRDLGINTLDVPASVTWINGDISGGSLTSVTLHEGLTTLGRDAFYTDNLDELYIPASVTNIADNMGRNIKKYVVDSNNKKYDSRNDCGCVIWTEINRLVKVGKNYTIPSTVKDVAASAFSYSFDFTSITIPSTVETIDYNAFLLAYDAEHISLPSTIVLRNYGLATTDIGTLISGCRKLKSFIIPDTVESLNKNAFYDVKVLENLYVPKLTSINEDSFSYLVSLKNIFINMTKAEWEALNYVDTSNRLENVTMYFKASSSAEVDASTENLFYRTDSSFYTKDGSFSL